MIIDEDKISLQNIIIVQKGFFSTHTIKNDTS